MFSKVFAGSELSLTFVLGIWSLTGLGYRRAYGLPPGGDDPNLFCILIHIS